jgi:hypothetical protein
MDASDLEYAWDSGGKFRRAHPAMVAAGQLVKKPGVTSEELWQALLAMVAEEMEALRRRGRNWEALADVFCAFIRNEITSDDYGDLYSAIYDGRQYRAEDLERRKLLRLARQALALKP